MSKIWKLLAGGVIVAMLSGGVAWAARGATQPSPTADVTSALGVASPGTPMPEAQGGRRAGFLRALLQRLANGELTLRLADGVHHIRIDHGVVQSVTSDSIVLLEPDGTTVTVPVGSQTRVFRNRQPASISQIAKGDVAFTIRDGDNPARSVRAFDPSVYQGDRGQGPGGPGGPTTRPSSPGL